MSVQTNTTVIDTWKEAALAEMTELAASDDYESAHMRADSILCELLVQLGCEDVVNQYEEVGKWYS